MKLVIAAAGTGGHVIPALTMAKKFTESGYDVIWLGTKEGIESRLVPDAGYKLVTLPKITGLRGKSLIFWLLAPFRILKSIFFTITFLLFNRPKFVLAMGGYVSGPVGIAAWLLRIPLVLHEQNAVAGTANKLLSGFATKILQAYPDSFANKKIKALTVGNPVRNEIASISRDDNKVGHGINVLVIGGSLGARDLNTAVIDYIKYYSNSQVRILHQSGKNDLERVQLNTKDLVVKKGNYKVVPYIKDMQEAYKWADLVISRSGAMSVAEIIQVAAPCIFVPFPFAIDDHQTANAKLVVNSKAGYMVKQSDFTADYLNDKFNEFLNDPKLLKSMHESMKLIRQPNVVDKIMIECESACN